MIRNDSYRGVVRDGSQSVTGVLNSNMAGVVLYRGNVSFPFQESKLSKVKRMITGSILMGRRKKESEGEKENNRGSGMSTEPVSVCLRKESAYGEALKELHIEIASSAATEIVLKPRKRKERLDSGGSLNQETKVIRSSSEERPEVKTDVSVRRVWSHDELKGLAEAQSKDVETEAEVDMRSADPLRELNSGTQGEDLEARRSSERFSRGRCVAPRRRKVTRRAPPPERSPSPSQTKFDVSSLHQQMEGDEPLTSRVKVLSPEEEPESPTVEALISPRNSLVMRLTYLDPNMPPSPPQMHLAAMRQHDKLERRLTKQINGIKRQIRRYEDGFRVEFGYKPSQADKMANKDIKRLCTEMARLKLQLKQLKEETSEMYAAAALKDEDPSTNTDEKPLGSPTKGTSFKSSTKSNNNKTMMDALQEVQKRLEEKRISSGRCSEIMDLTNEQVLEEKLAVQKALLTLENSFGRPVDPTDRDLVRPLYQRYRALKRIIIRTSAGKINNSASELATILEHEAMEFSTSASIEQSDEQCDQPSAENFQELEVAAAPLDDVVASSSSSDSLAENLHALPLSQLLEQQKRLKDEKKQLRRSLRDFDDRFQSENGRRAQKQDRLAIEAIYLGYKQSKAKLRLLEALIAKKSQVKRNSC